MYNLDILAWHLGSILANVCQTRHSIEGKSNEMHEISSLDQTYNERRIMEILEIFDFWKKKIDSLVRQNEACTQILRCEGVRVGDYSSKMVLK